MSVRRDDVFLTLSGLLRTTSLRLRHSSQPTISSSMLRRGLGSPPLDSVRSIFTQMLCKQRFEKHTARMLSKEYPSMERTVVSNKSHLQQVIDRYDLFVIDDASSRLRGPQKAASSKNVDDKNEDVSPIHLGMLYQQLIHPVKEFIGQSKKHLIIVPEGLLFFAPFCAFLDEAGRPLSEKYSIQMTPSLHTLCATMEQRHNSPLGYAFVVGNPTVGCVTLRGASINHGNLKHSSEEASKVAGLFNATALVESAAKKETVLKYIWEASIIHIAAHGDPEMGEVLLAVPNNTCLRSGQSVADPPKEEEFLLQVQDILGKQLQAKLVVLNICFSARGKISPEGVNGLARAFLAAGARAVLLTLWNVRDLAGKLVIEVFYNEVLAGMSVCEALRRSTKELRKSEKFNHYSLWAPFIIFGEGVKFSKDEIETIRERSISMSFV